MFSKFQSDVFIGACCSMQKCTRQIFPMMTVIKWKPFPHYWPFVWGIHWWPVNSPHKGQWRGALMFLIRARINGWINNGEAGDLRRRHVHYDVIVMLNAPFCNRKVYIFVTKWHTVGYVSNSMWDLWDGSKRWQINFVQVMACCQKDWNWWWQPSTSPYVSPGHSKPCLSINAMWYFESCFLLSVHVKRVW